MKYLGSGINIYMCRKGQSLIIYPLKPRYSLRHIDIDTKVFYAAVLDKEQMFAGSHFLLSFNSIQIDIICDDVMEIAHTANELLELGKTRK